MKLIKLTTEEILNHPTREYNPSEWTNTVNRFLKYKDVTFYIEERPRNQEYDRFFATYTIPEGLNLLGEVSYSSCLNNNGFCKVFIAEDGTVTKGLFKDGTGAEGYAENTKQNRANLSNFCQRTGTYITTKI